MTTPSTGASKRAEACIKAYISVQSLMLRSAATHCGLVPCMGLGETAALSLIVVHIIILSSPEYRSSDVARPAPCRLDDFLSPRRTHLQRCRR